MQPADVRARVRSLLRHRSEPGRLDAITDVGGVRVGHQDVRRPPDIVTGVTAVRFAALESARRTLPAAVEVGNGHGKLVGVTQLRELGEIETPIILTSTLSTFLAADVLVDWVLRQPGHERTTTLNPVVAECNDGWLSDIRARAITAADVTAALEAADPTLTGAERPAEGCVGAGSGMICMGYKGGIGTASRQAVIDGRPVTVGALALTNFGGRLRIGPLDLDADDVLGNAAGRPSRPEQSADPRTIANSCIILLITDAPVDARQLGRLARRGVFSLGRVGAGYWHGSGDYGIAVSTAVPAPALPDHQLDPLLTAALESAEAAILSSLIAARTTSGRRGRVAYGLPHDLLDRTQLDGV